MNQLQIIKNAALGLIAVAFIAGASPVYGSDGLMYMDESGNIHFAEGVSQIPKKYVGQVVKPSPVNLDPKQYKKEYAKKMKAIQKKEAFEKKKKERLKLIQKKKQERANKSKKREAMKRKKAEKMDAKKVEKF